jgi:hypothetical protein
MPSVTTDFASHVRIHSLSSDNHGSLLIRQIIHSFHEQVHLGVQHIRFLDGMCTPLTWLESIITSPLVGDHLLNKFGCFNNSKREERPSRSSINMASGYQSQPIIETLKNKPVVHPMMGTS